MMYKLQKDFSCAIMSTFACLLLFIGTFPWLSTSMSLVYSLMHDYALPCQWIYRSSLKL